jgi:hypothetical protein
MRPAFSSTKQAAAFALLLLVLLVLPVVMGKNLLPPREQSYAIQGWDNGPYPWLHQQIFEETNEIDIAFVGSSLMMWGIDTPYVQAKLSAQLGRPAVVRSICWGGTGYDALFFITQDLLAHRKVRLLVFYDEDNVLKGYRNTQAPIWFRYGDNAGALAGLPLMEKTLFYFAAIIGAPRNLLGLLRPNLPLALTSSTPNYMETLFHTPNPATRLGSVAAQLTCNPTADGQPFEAFTPHTETSPADVCIYSPTNRFGFQFLDEPLPAWQKHFAIKFGVLAAQHGCKLVLLNLPLFDKDRPAVLQERFFWPDVFSNQLTIVGIPPARLLAGLSEADVYLLYGNAGHRNNAYASHLNQNGQEFFTQLITPALIELYEAAGKP